MADHPIRYIQFFPKFLSSHLIYIHVAVFLGLYVGNSIAFDHEIPAVPKYAPFVAAGFFFGPASFLHEVKRKAEFQHCFFLVT